MTRPRLRKISIGLVLWIGACVYLVRLATAERADEDSSLDALAEYFMAREVEFELRFETAAPLEVGDLVEDEDGRPVGDVSALLDAEGNLQADLYDRVSAAKIRLYDRRTTILREDASVRLVQVPASFAWVITELIPPEKLHLVNEEWNRAWRRDHRAILAKVQPVVADFLTDIEETLKAEAGPFLQRHRREIDRLFRKAETPLDSVELSDVFEKDVWPTIRKHLEPVTDDIREEVWEQFPLWGLSWRFAYQSLPLTRDDHFRHRWRSFVETEVVPILKSHSGEFLKASRQIARETLENPRVASTIHDFAMRLAGDPEFHQMAQVFLQEVFIDNPRFRARLKERWETPAVREAVEFISDRLEETVRRVGDLLLGTTKTGISPEFARVLRAQILKKGKRRIVIDPGTPSKAPLGAGSPLWVTVVEEKLR